MDKVERVLKCARQYATARRLLLTSGSFDAETERLEYRRGEAAAAVELLESAIELDDAEPQPAWKNLEVTNAAS